MALPAGLAATLDHEYESLQSDFADFHLARDLDGNWNRLRQARLPPDLHPDLKLYAQGLQYMSGMLEDDIRIHKLIRQMNPTRFNALVRGTAQASRDLESDWKLVMASYWDNDLNEGRWLDSYNYEGQVGLGLSVNRLVWRKQTLEDEEGTRPVSGCPVRVEKVLVDSMRWQGSFMNPSVALCRYSVSVIDCGLKNKQGERPYYKAADAKDLGWTSEMLPENYKNNAGKMIDVIVRDAEDPVAMCPLPGCDHRKRRIAVYICPVGAKAEQYEQVEEYDSPFERCSFLIVGGDVRHAERDPHRMLRPSAWVLFDLVLQYNFFFNSLIASYFRDLADTRQYIDASGTQNEVLMALAGDEDEGQSGVVDKPDIGGQQMKVLPGPVRNYGIPSTADLMKLLEEIKREYAMRRPNPALTGQMVISETTGTAAQLQVAGAGVLLGDDLTNWDAGIVRIFHELRHGIRFTSYYEPDDAQTRYVATVSGRESVAGYRKSKAGDEVFLDAKKCEKAVSFLALTSKETPQESRNRKEMAIIGFEKGIYTEGQLLEQWDIYDIPSQEKELFRADVRKLVKPLSERRIALILARQSAALTGIDFGEADLISQTLPDIGGEGNPGEQAYHQRQFANTARLNTPPVDVQPTGNPAGGSSGLA